MWTRLIFSTKERYPFLADKDIREEMHAYLSSILRKHDCPTLLVGGVADHVHVLLFALSRNRSIAEIVYEVKRSSSEWIKTQRAGYKKFFWQSGYGAFSVSQSHVEQVRKYIAWQERHHHKVTFQDEYREFLRRYDVDYCKREILHQSYWEAFKNL